MKRIKNVVLVLFVLLLTTYFASAQNIIGQWSIVANGSPGTLTIESTGSGYTGSFNVGSNEAISNVSFNNSTGIIYFIRVSCNQHYTGTVNGNTISGTFDVSYKWTGTRISGGGNPNTNNSGMNNSGTNNTISSPIGQWSIVANGSPGTLTIESTGSGYTGSFNVGSNEPISNVSFNNSTGIIDFIRVSCNQHYTGTVNANTISGTFDVSYKWTGTRISGGGNPITNNSGFSNSGTNNSGTNTITGSPIGQWSIVANGSPGTLTIESNGFGYTGSFNVGSNEAISNVSFNNSTGVLNFIRVSCNQHYTGTVNGNTISGTFDGSYKWTGTRIGSSTGIQQSSAEGTTTLFDNWNKSAVENGPKNPTFFQVTGNWYISRICNYHWNNGNGAYPGTISLIDQNGNRYGPWQAVATSGTGGANSVNWVVNPNITIPQGNYRVVDSDQSTFSTNSISGYQGFVTIQGSKNPVTNNSEPSNSGTNSTILSVFGQWSIVANGTPGTLTIESTGSGYTGSFNVGSNEAISNVSFNNSTGVLNFIRVSCNQHYTGTVNGNTISGTFDGSYKWTGTRVGSSTGNQPSSSEGTITLFDNWNKSAVENGPKTPTFFQVTGNWYISRLCNYHWNNGNGAYPGTISLIDQNGNTYGPWQAVATSGTGGAKSVNWVVNPNITIPQGNYRVVDSDLSTFSTNSISGYQGFVTIQGSK